VERVKWSKARSASKERKFRLARYLPRKLNGTLGWFRSGLLELAPEKEAAWSAGFAAEGSAGSRVAVRRVRKGAVIEWVKFMRLQKS